MKRSLHQQCLQRLLSHCLSTRVIASLTFAPSWVQIVGTEADWNIKGEASPQLNDRRLDLHRGRYQKNRSRKTRNEVPV